MPLYLCLQSCRHSSGLTFIIFTTNLKHFARGKEWVAIFPSLLLSSLSCSKTSTSLPIHPEPFFLWRNCIFTACNATKRAKPRPTRRKIMPGTCSICIFYHIDGISSHSGRPPLLRLRHDSPNRRRYETTFTSKRVRNTESCESHQP